MAIDNRYPTIRFPRLHGGEAGLRWILYWNGSRAANGDGEPGDGAAVDYDEPIAGPFELWPSGKFGFCHGGFAMGGFAVGRPLIGPALGFAQGPFAIGNFCRPGGYASYTFTFALRDGEYSVGVLFADRLGNIAGSGVEVTFEVAALPRPSPALRLESYDSGSNTLVVSFDSSPDLE